MLEFDFEELAENDGREGKPVYVAHEGKVYDVSASKLWRTGTHMRRHHSGRDLTTDLGAAPHGPEVLERFPRVGLIRRPPAAEAPPETFLEPLFKWQPFLRRHPHPMTVHFPIVFMLSATVFTLLFLATGNRSFEATAFHCLAGGLLFTPLVMLTGFTSWWANYLARPVRAVVVKISVSFLMLADSLCAFAWRAATPDILTDFRLASVIYVLLILLLFPMVAVIGWHGAMLTFPMEKS